MTIDIGGTKTEFMLFDNRIINEKKYYNSDYNSFIDILSDFVVNEKDIQTIIIAVAGPITTSNLIKVTNAPWLIDKTDITETLPNSKLFIINDIEALGYYIQNTNNERDTFTLYEGKEKEKNSIVLGLGTGFGVAFNINNKILTSEAGHSYFHPMDYMDFELIEFLNNKGKETTIENVCSAIGLQNLYEFYSQEKFGYEDPKHQEQFKLVNDKARLILNHATGKTKCDFCDVIVNKAVDFLAFKLKELVLITKCDTIYLFGGFTSKLITYIKNERFKKNIYYSKKMQSILSRVSIHYIKEPRAVLLGCVYYSRHLDNNLH